MKRYNSRNLLLVSIEWAKSMKPLKSQNSLLQMMDNFPYGATTFPLIFTKRDISLRFIKYYIIHVLFIRFSASYDMVTRRIAEEPDCVVVSIE